LHAAGGTGSGDIHVCCGCGGNGRPAYLLPDGSIHAPFQTAGAAQAAVRRRLLSYATDGHPSPTTVWLSGTCLGESLRFDARDGGLSEASRVTWRGLGPAGAVVGPGVAIQASWLTPVTDAGVLAQAPPAARGALVELDLAAHGLGGSGGGPACRTFAAGSAEILPDTLSPTQAELFFIGAGGAGLADARPLQLAEWPNVGGNFSAPLTPPLAWPRVLAVSRAANRTAVVGPDVAAHISSAGWAQQLAQDPGSAMAHYYSTWFSDLHWPITAINVSAAGGGGNGTVTMGVCGNMTVGETHMGAKQYFTVYNLLSELDLPGEYTLNVTAQKMFAWLPPGQAAGDLTSADPVVGALSGAGNAVELTDVAYMTLDGLVVRFARGAGIVLNNCTGIVISNCSIASVGIMGVNITGGINNTVTNSSIFDAGNGGVYMCVASVLLLCCCFALISLSLIHPHSVLSAGMPVTGWPSRRAMPVWRAPSSTRSIGTRAATYQG